MSINATTVMVQIVSASLAGYLTSFLGGLDGLIHTLIVFMVIDYIIGVLVAIIEKDICSVVGFRIIAKKLLIFLIVIIAELLDSYFTGAPGILRTTTIYFYLSNEGISIVENSKRLGVKVPPRINKALYLLRSDLDNEDLDRKIKPPKQSE